MNHSSDKPDKEEPEEIIEDLESIKDLLNEESHTQLSDKPTPSNQGLDLGDEVPLLDDPVEEVAQVHEGLPDDTFQTLLGDAWQDSVDELFNNARANIESNSTAWLPEHTDELSQALKIRIDASVKSWLAETLEANISLLRERIVTELSAELIEQLREKLTHPQDAKENDPNHG